jgi:methionine biosynthesis protein MetW
MVLRLIQSTNRSFDRILDIGCGDGALTARIKEIANATETYGIDLDPKKVKTALSRGIDALQLDIDANDFPFIDNYFDLVYCGELIEHLKDPDHLIDEIRRILRANGLCLIDTPNLAAWHNRIALALGYQPTYTQVSDRHNVGKLRPGMTTPDSSYSRGHHRVFTNRAMKELIRRHNFEIRADSYKGRGATDPGIPGPFRAIDLFCSLIPSLSTFTILVVEKEGTHRRKQPDIL